MNDKFAVPFKEKEIKQKEIAELNRLKAKYEA